MSVRPAWDDSTSPLRRKALSLLWGDRIGLLIFLLSLCLFGLTWRTAFLINDSYTSRTAFMRWNTGRST